MSGVARRHGINPNQLFTWRRQLCKVGAGAVLAARDDAAGPLGAGAAADAIALLLGRVTIRVRPGVDGAALRRVLAALEGRP